MNHGCDAVNAHGESTREWVAATGVDGSFGLITAGRSNLSLPS